MILYRSTYFQFSKSVCIQARRIWLVWIRTSMNSTNKHILLTRIIINKKFYTAIIIELRHIKAPVEIVNYINRDNFKNNIKETNQ